MEELPPTAGTEDTETTRYDDVHVTGHPARGQRQTHGRRVRCTTTADEHTALDGANTADRRVDNSLRAHVLTEGDEPMVRGNDHSFDAHLSEARDHAGQEVDDRIEL